MVTEVIITGGRLKDKMNHGEDIVDHTGRITREVGVFNAEGHRGTKTESQK